MTQIGLFDGLEAAQLKLAAQILATGRAEGLARMDEARAYARRSHPETSHQAAASMTAKAITDNRQAILDLLRITGPLCDTEIGEYYETWKAHYRWPKQSVSGLRARRSELVSALLVVDTGKRVPLVSGRMSIVWQAVARDS